MADHSTNGAASLSAAGGSRRAVFVISLICAAQFVLQLDFSVVNVALPSIQRELGMPAAELQWIVTGYALWPITLIIARIEQGAAGTMVSPAALSPLTTTNAEGAARNRALAIWPAGCSPSTSAGGRCS